MYEDSWIVVTARNMLSGVLTLRQSCENSGLLPSALLKSYIDHVDLNQWSCLSRILDRQLHVYLVVHVVLSDLLLQLILHVIRSKQISTCSGCHYNQSM